MKKVYKYNEFISEKKKDDPCWKSYKQVGMKKKNGKEVPNCVPDKEDKIKKQYSKKGDKKV